MKTTMHEETTGTTETLATLIGIQNNNTKQRIRDIINMQGVNFAKQTNSVLCSLSLPSTEWRFEKGHGESLGLIDHCEKNNIKLVMTAIEGSPSAAVYKEFEQNAPKKFDIDSNLFLHKGDFDSTLLSTIEKEVLWNLVWADYCGNPAEIKNRILGTYSYPHIMAFKDFVKKATKPSLYYMTFSCNGRIVGGKKNMLKALSCNSSQVHSAIRQKISATLRQYGLLNKVTPILDIYYHGSGKSFMFTIGFAINFKPKFQVVREDWVADWRKIKNMEKAIKKPRVVKTEEVEVDEVAIRKEAMKGLCDLGWNNEKIAMVLKVSVAKVSSVISWHKHRTSWKKSA